MLGLDVDDVMMTITPTPTRPQAGTYCPHQLRQQFSNTAHIAMLERKHAYDTSKLKADGSRLRNACWWIR